MRNYRSWLLSSQHWSNLKKAPDDALRPLTDAEIDCVAGGATLPPLSERVRMQAEARRHRRRWPAV